MQKCANGIYEKVLELYNCNHNKVLDLGCGSGILSSKVKDKYPFSDITCSDFNALDYEYTADFIPCNLNYELPFEDNSFDVVLLIEVIEHVRNPALLLDEIYRILKNGGVLILSTPNVENLQSRLHFLFQGRFFSFLDNDMPKYKDVGMGHINPLFNFQLNTLIEDKFKITDKVYNRIRIPLLKHNMPTSISLFGEIKIIKMRKVIK